MTKSKLSLASGNSTPMLCGHCGRQSVFQPRGEGTQYDAVRWKNPIDALKIGIEGETITTWRILECTMCHQPTLAQEVVNYGFDYEIGTEIRAADTTVLYPKAPARMLPTNLPLKIAEEYEAALQVQHISLNACAVLLRRTLEAIFNHEKAGGRTLSDKIDHLMRSETIPPLLAGMAHLGREIGNIGAHADAGEVTEEDIAVLLNFIDVMFVYLYTTPTKVLAFKEKLKKTP